jgi:hypothetical protein
MVGGRIIESRPKDADCEKVRGRFEPIISEDTFNLAQKIKAGKPLPINTSTALQNSLSGLVYCAKCGNLMTRQPSNTRLRYAVLRCANSKCSNISSPLSLIEEQVIQGLKEWIPEYNVEWPEQSENEGETTLTVLENSIGNIEEKLIQTVRQLNKTFDLLEQGVYSLETFQDRRVTLDSQKVQLEEELERIEKERDRITAMEQARKDFIPAIERLIEAYWEVDDIITRNSMLRNVIDRIDYLKLERNKKGAGNTANFTLNIFPRIPENR